MIITTVMTMSIITGKAVILTVMTDMRDITMRMKCFLSGGLKLYEDSAERSLRIYWR